MDEPDEIEILRGDKVRITTRTVTVGDSVMPMAAITEAAFVEADHRIRLAPKLLFVAAPVIGFAFFLASNDFIPALAAAMLILVGGMVLYRDSWAHQVTVRLFTGRSETLYRTPRKGDALLFHAAIEKALAINAEADLYAATPPQPDA